MWFCWHKKNWNKVEIAIKVFVLMGKTLSWCFVYEYLVTKVWFLFFQTQSMMCIFPLINVCSTINALETVIRFFLISNYDCLAQIETKQFNCLIPYSLIQCIKCLSMYFQYIHDTNTQTVVSFSMVKIVRCMFEPFGNQYAMKYFISMNICFRWFTYAMKCTKTLWYQRIFSLMKPHNV